MKRARSAVAGPKRKPQLGSYRVEQRWIEYQGRALHFVSYDGQNANPSRGQLAAPPMWHLMASGTRWPVIQQIPGEDSASTDRRLLDWVKQNIK
jgi:hypothetical protein